MKLLTILSALMFSVQVFAATPYTFHCSFVGDSCKIENVSDMVEIETGLFGGEEGNFALFYQPKSASMQIYLGEEMKAIAIGANTLGIQNEAKDGLVGIILGDDKAAVKALHIARPLK